MTTVDLTNDSDGEDVKPNHGRKRSAPPAAPATGKKRAKIPLGTVLVRTKNFQMRG